jgi:hypothetical protein
MITPSSNKAAAGGPQRLPWARLVFIASALAVPACYLVGSRLSGENHFGQGLEGSLYWGVFWAVQALCFFGLSFSPCLNSRSDTRQGLFMVLGVIVFVLDELLSFAFIAFGMFPD